YLRIPIVVVATLYYIWFATKSRGFQWDQAVGLVFWTYLFAWGYWTAGRHHLLSKRTRALNGAFGCVLPSLLILTVSVAISLAGYRSARAAKESIGNTSACLVAKITEIQGRQERIQGLVEEVNHEAKTRNELA